MEMNPETEMSLIGHLTELRSRIIISLLSLIVCVIFALFIAKPVLGVLTYPIKGMASEPGRNDTLTLLVNPDNTLRIHGARPSKIDLKTLSSKRFQLVWPADLKTHQTTTTMVMGESASQQFYYTSPMDPIMLQLKVALIVGIMICLPILLWQIWGFVNPGLKKRERAIVKPLLSGAVFLFPLGAAFAFYVVQLVLKIMQIYTVQNVAPWLDIFKYLSLLFNMMLIFGVIFEIPLILAIASRIGLVNPEFLKTYRRHAYVALAFAAMVLSPGTDPFTMIIVLLPLMGLYELSVVLSVFMARLHRADLEANLTEDDDDEDMKADV